MSTAGRAPECQQGVHRLCAGNRVIKREGAPAWEAPIMTLRCGCACHGRRKTA